MIPISKADVEELRNKLTSYKPATWAVMMAHYIFDKANREGDAMADLTALDLEAVMAYQDSKCAVLDVGFYIPSSADLKGKSYHSWLNRLKEDRRPYAPMPIRLDKSRPWGIDNIVIVTPSINDIYQICSEDIMLLSVKLTDHLPKRVKDLFDGDKIKERTKMWLDSINKRDHSA